MKLSIVSALSALLLSFSSLKSGSLTDIAKPYLGEYRCEMATLGSNNCLEQFKDVILELKDENTYEIRYQLKNGYKGAEEGKYVYDKEKQTLTLTLGKVEQWKREVPIKNGKIYISVPLGDTLLYLRFIQK